MGMIDKILLLYLCIAIACAFWQPGIVFGNSNSGITGIFNLTYDVNTNEPSLPTCTNVQGSNLNCLKSDFIQTLPTFGNETLINKVFTQLASGANFFIDALNNVIGIIKIFFNVLFSPWIIFTSPQMAMAPTSAFFYILALPLVLLAFIAFINWIRSGIT